MNILAQSQPAALDERQFEFKQPLSPTALSQAEKFIDDQAKIETQPGIRDSLAWMQDALA
jgi:hypothetical protein